MDILREWRRMCTEGMFGDVDSCDGCPLDGEVHGGCLIYEMSDREIDTVKERVDQWSKDHPEKTYATVFFEKFPDADRDLQKEYAVPSVCLKKVFGYAHCPSLETCLHENCAYCWNREYEG